MESKLDQQVESLWETYQDSSKFWDDYERLYKIATSTSKTQRVQVHQEILPQVTTPIINPPTKASKKSRLGWRLMVWVIVLLLVLLKLYQVSHDSRIKLPIQDLVKIKGEHEILIKQKILFDYSSVTDGKRLDISNRKLIRWPKILFQLSSLEYLNLSDNNLEYLPNSIGKFKNLKHLNLKSNKIQTLSPSFTQLVNLEKLDLSHNQISNFSQELTYLRNLKSLNLSGCPILYLPSKVEKLTSLEYLNLSHCFLRSLPEEIKHLKNLKYLYLLGNPLSGQEIKRVKELLPYTKIFVDKPYDGTKR